MAAGDSSCILNVRGKKHSYCIPTDIKPTGWSQFPFLFFFFLVIRDTDFEPTDENDALVNRFATLSKLPSEELKLSKII